MITIGHIWRDFDTSKLLPRMCEDRGVWSPTVQAASRANNTQASTSWLDA